MLPGKKRLGRELKETLDSKSNKRKVIPGLMGVYINSVPTTTVEGRADFVWVRIRGATSEPVMAFNEKVQHQFDLPVLIERDELVANRWVVVGRDVATYQDWGGLGYATPPHGNTHSLANVRGTGSDVAWIYKRQFMPLLPHPQATGAMSLFIEAGYYFFNGTYRHWPGSGTIDFSSFIPTGSNNGKFATVFIEGDTGVLQYIGGEEFNAQVPPIDLIQLVPLPAQDTGIPIASVFLFTGITFLNWANIFDLRFAPTVPPATGTTVGIWDSGVPLGKADTLDFASNVSVTLSGTHAKIDVNASYARAALPIALTTITGVYWKVPDEGYATGSLSVQINGVTQQPGVDFTEQFPISGTYQLTEVAPTGTVHSTIYGTISV